MTEKTSAASTFALRSYWAGALVTGCALLCLAENPPPLHAHPGPLTTLMEFSIEVDQAFAQFGTSVSPAGDVNGDGYADIIVAADGFTNEGGVDGRVFVYYGSSLGIAATPDWSMQSDLSLTAHEGPVAWAGDVNGDGFDDIIVGAPNDEAKGVNRGRASVFYGSASGLSSAPDWSATGAQPHARFAAAVAGAGDIDNDGYDDVLVGAPYHDGAQGDEGCLFVYRGSADGLRSSPDATIGCGLANAHFGCAVAIAGDVNGDGFDDVVVGANTHSESGDRAGAAFVYHGSANGIRTSPDWTAQHKRENANFAAAVAGAGDVNGDGFDDVIVGAHYDTRDHESEGQGFVYYGSASGLNEKPSWTAAGGQIRAEFGRSVASAGDVNQDGYDDVIVGALDHDAEHVDGGRAVVYFGSASGLSTEPGWERDGDQEEAYFGCSVSRAGDVNGDGYEDLVVGAARYDGGEKNEGRARVFYGSSRGPGWRHCWRAESNQLDANLGSSVASAGDVNGDGCADVVLAAMAYEPGEAGDGRVLVYSGSTGGLDGEPSWTREGRDAEAPYAIVVAAGGDLNSDGYDDVLVGAPTWREDAGGCGKAVAFVGTADGLRRKPGWHKGGRKNGVEHSSCFGNAVACAGDVNGDGFDDAVVGAPRYSHGQSDEGRAVVFHGSPTGLSAEPDWSFESDTKDAFFGSSAAPAGDVNGDGFDDLIVGADRFDNRFRDEGAAFLFLGSASGLASVPSWSAYGERSAAWFGTCVASAGDVNHDGYDDVLVGAPRHNNGQHDEGIAFLFLGSPAGLSPAPAWKAEGNEIYAYFGHSVAPVGDIDHDGYDDVLVGARGADAAGKADVGKAFLYCGCASGLAETPRWTAVGPHEGSYFGNPVACAGDVNADGYNDLLIGAERFSNGELREGAAFVFYMGPGAPRKLADATSRGTDAPVSPTR